MYRWIIDDYVDDDDDDDDDDKWVFFDHNDYKNDAN
jgi:hypothetical protein